MELRIVGTEQELAEFLKALGTSKVIANAIVDKSKAVPKAKTKFVDTKYLANKYGLTGQAIRNYVKRGMPHKRIDNSYQYNEADASAWIDNYISTHESKTRGKKYRNKDVSANTKIQIKKTNNFSDYTKWRRNISAICRESGMDEGKLLSQTYKYMTKNYGIVWEQLAKDFYKTNGRKPASTLESAYALEKSNSVYTNLLEGCIDTVIKEERRVKV